jgi:hypothetical protein
MKMRIVMDDRTLTATLAENLTARDFASLLPLTLTLSDYASTEKISYLPRKLHPQGAPDGIDPTVGDIAYYAPGAIWRSFTRISDTPPVSSGSVSSTLVQTCSPARAP